MRSSRAVLAIIVVLDGNAADAVARDSGHHRVDAVRGAVSIIGTTGTPGHRLRRALCYRPHHVGAQRRRRHGLRSRSVIRELARIAL